MVVKFAGVDALYLKDRRSEENFFWVISDRNHDSLYNMILLFSDLFASLANSS